LSNIDPDSLSTLSIWLFKGLMVVAFGGLRFYGLEQVVWSFRGLEAGGWGLGTGMYRRTSDLIRNPQSAIRNPKSEMLTSQSACSFVVASHSHCSIVGPSEFAWSFESCCGQTHRQPGYAYRSDLRYPRWASQTLGCDSSDSSNISWNVGRRGSWSVVVGI
jgi:hypothetical protein